MLQVLANDAIWKIAETAKEAVQGKLERIEHSARIAEVAVDVVANSALAGSSSIRCIVQKGLRRDILLAGLVTRFR
jgi:hypothetical protein